MEERKRMNHNSDSRIVYLFTKCIRLLAILVTRMLYDNEDVT